jgi:hypothetical protein
MEAVELIRGQKELLAETEDFFLKGIEDGVTDSPEWLQELMTRSLTAVFATEMNTGSSISMDGDKLMVDMNPEFKI